MRQFVAIRLSLIGLLLSGFISNAKAADQDSPFAPYAGAYLVKAQICYDLDANGEEKEITCSYKVNEIVVHVTSQKQTEFIYLSPNSASKTKTLREIMIDAEEIFTQASFRAFENRAEWVLEAAGILSSRYERMEISRPADMKEYVHESLWKDTEPTYLRTFYVLKKI